MRSEPARCGSGSRPAASTTPAQGDDPNSRLPAASPHRPLAGSETVNGEDRLKSSTRPTHPRLAEEICAELGQTLGAATVGRFPDGEVEVKIHDDIRGADVFLVQPTCPPVNDSLIELLLMIDCCLRASADRITAVIPYFG